MSLLTELVRGLPAADSQRLSTVFAYSEAHLSNVKRRSGENYARHGLEVASVLKEASSTTVLLSVALLHDILVHPDGERLLRQSPLSVTERNLVQQMFGMRRRHIDRNADDLDDVIQAFTTNDRLLPLRMAHRLNDVRHLDRFTTSLSKQIADETLHMYSAIAGRLGMSRWRIEMEDICFRRLQPGIARQLAEQFGQTAEMDRLCLDHACRYLRRQLKKHNIPHQVDSRIKGLYSTYRKMLLKKRGFSDLTDRLAVRIVVPDINDCYLALGVVHAVLHPIPGKLKDYIGAPKENGYRSIHTVVYPLPGVTELPIEVQIRTEQMHLDNEFGYLSHGEYKNARYALNAKPARVNISRNLASLREEADSPQQFETVLRKYFSDQHMVIFDTSNNMYHVRRPATALDFIYMAFPRRLSHCKAVRINGREQPLQYQLTDGDVVDVSYARSVVASRQWLQHCQHQATKKHLKTILQKPAASPRT